MIVIGDITGKGIDTASLTAQVRYTLRAASRFLSSPASLLAHLDSELKRSPGSLSLCTALCVMLNPARDHVVFSAGGHPLPLRISAAGVQTVGVPGPLVGGLSNPRWTDHVVEMNPGDTLLLYTDGVTDAMGDNRERFGVDRLIRTISPIGDRSAAGLIEELSHAPHTFEQGPQVDDKAILALAKIVASARAKASPANSVTPVV